VHLYSGQLINRLCSQAQLTNRSFQSLPNISRITVSLDHKRPGVELRLTYLERLLRSADPHIFQR
jgi:hypothetical protein